MVVHVYVNTHMSTRTPDKSYANITPSDTLCAQKPPEHDVRIPAFANGSSYVAMGPYT